MAIDTVVLRSPELSEYIYLQLKRNVVKRLSIDVETGEQLYCFTSAELKGSFDYRIRVRLKDEKFYYDKSAESTSKVKCGYFLEVECSIHKLLMGHNVCGGTDDFYRSMAYLVFFLEYQFEVKLPNFHLWELHRIDLAEIYRLPSLDVVLLYIEGIKNLRYPRRKTFFYDNECVYWAGGTSTVKFYSKGLEYMKHDFARLCRCLGRNQALFLAEIADKILRVEVEIKKRKLVSMFKKVPLVQDININDLYFVYDEEINKILGGGMEMENAIRLSVDVEKRLFEFYKPKMAKTLLGTWYMLSQRGESYVKKILSDRTFYRHKKLLKDIGIGWDGSDLQIDYTGFESVIPIDFKAVRSSKYRIDFVAPIVEEKLGKIRLLA